jgi:hypothetical protein
LLANYGKGNIPELSIIESFSKATQGWVTEAFCGIVQKYCEKYPEVFKKAMVKDNLHKILLGEYIFSVYPNWCGSKFYMQKSKYNDSLLKLTPQYLLLKDKDDSCLKAMRK